MNFIFYRKTLYLTLFVLGVASGFVLNLFASWADFEASNYGFDRVGSDRMSGLYCPIFMTANEIGSFSVRAKNNTGKNLSPSIRTDVSTPGLLEKTYTRLHLNAGETQTVSLNISPENIDMNSFIFIRAWLYAGYPLKDKENTCGVFILHLPGKGASYTWGLVGLSLLGMGIGLGSLRQVQGQEGAEINFNRMAALAVIILAGLIVSLAGIWLAGVVILVMSVLLMLISFGGVQGL